MTPPATPPHDPPASAGVLGYDKQGHVVTITMNRPHALNAINGELREALNAAWLAFRDDPDAWVAILTGAGRAFCAGADLRDGAGAVGTWPGTFWEIPTINSFESGLELYKPVIAAVNGHCIGYGFTGALACDFIIASEEATFGFPEVRLGTPTIVGAIRLPRRIGWSDAMELLLTGERVSAERAREMGLVWRVVEHESLADAAAELADRLVRSAPLAVRATKEVAMRTASLPWTEAVRFGETMRKVAGATEDAAEGRVAFAEGRTPEWKGR
ncbi:MAG: enoyl-CoA hydratase/isomerase family protein [Acidimicrobiales bacterium]|nr:enoyl-CoA hydratase/isomerase family protein [Acidimicrobiales bacterium]